jgi:hypothetical protein
VIQNLCKLCPKLAEDNEQTRQYEQLVLNVSLNDDTLSKAFRLMEILLVWLCSLSRASDFARFVATRRASVRTSVGRSASRASSRPAWELVEQVNKEIEQTVMIHVFGNSVNDSREKPFKI